MCLYIYLYTKCVCEFISVVAMSTGKKGSGRWTVSKEAFVWVNVSVCLSVSLLAL